MHASYYTSNDPNAYIPQETFQPTPPYAYGGTSSVASTQFTPPIEGTPSTSVPEIHEEAVPPSISAPPQQPAEKKARRAPEYNQKWAKWYHITKDENGYMLTLDCLVKNCKNPFFVYKMSSGMSSFKRHAETHEKKGEFPSTEPKQIQTLINADGTRTNPKFDEKNA